MKNPKLAAISVTAGLAVASFAGFIGLAGAATAATGSTTATFALTGGALSITVPASTVALNTGVVSAGAATAAGLLGPVTVTDGRGQLLNSWAMTVSSTPFTTGTLPTADETVAAANIAYTSGAATTHTGLGLFVPTLVPTALGADASYVGAAGNSSTTWDPTLTFTLLSSQVAGTYSGTVTHSVA